MKNLIKAFVTFIGIILVIIATVTTVMATIAFFGYLIGFGFVSTFQMAETLVAGFMISTPVFIAMASTSNL